MRNVLRHSMNKVQSKNHGIETYESRKNSLLRFDDKFYILFNGIDALDLGA